ncbi:hypothetical protein [Niallia circulans]|uniref:hypothetical protein n=1 Tax=Niallia circulans TaxID=1397 RepID=UPI00155FDB7A|nr:hypothetical protein [Niallia circulans]NRG32922.1 hypothetical protein [Niallia circulans]
MLINKVKNSIQLCRNKCIYNYRKIRYIYLRIRRKLIKTKWWLVVEFLKYTMSRFLLLVILLASTYYISKVISLEILVSLCVSILLFVLMYDLLNSVIKIMNYLDDKKLSKTYKKTKNITLYRWSEGIEKEERAFYHVLLEKADKSPLTNLVTIKQRIESLCSNDLVKLKLLDAYIERRLSSNFIEKFWSVCIGLAVTALTAILNKIIAKESFIQKIDEYINHTEVINNATIIIKFINYSTYFVLLVIYLVYFWHLFSKDKQRLKLIRKIINISIEQKET